MGNKNKRTGTEWETRIVNTCRGQGFEAERLTLTGANDEGDVVIKDTEGGRVIVVEAKAERQINLSSYVRQAVTERNNYCRKRGLNPDSVDAVVFIKRRNHSIGEGYAVTTIKEYLRLKKGQGK